MSVGKAKFPLVRLLLSAALACAGLTAVSLAPAAAAAVPELDPLECLSDQIKGAGCAKQVQGIYQPTAIATSPDGANVYVVTSGSAASGSQLTSLDRNTSTGALELRATTDMRTVPSLAGANGVAVSPDGQNVYVSASSSLSKGAVTVFQRDPATGALAFGQCWAETVHGDCTKAFPESGALIGARGIAAGDGFVYITAYSSGVNPGTLTVMDRDAADSGRLVPRTNGSTSAPNAFGVAVSPVSFRHVYVTDGSASTGAVRWFMEQSGVWKEQACWTGRADPAAGCKRVATELQGARGLAISADGGWIFVASQASGSLTALEDRGGQNFDVKKCWSAAGSSDCTKVEALKGARSVAVTADTTSVYVAASLQGGSDLNSMSAFAGSSVGAWRYDDCWQSGTRFRSCTSLPKGSSYGANGVTASGDDGNVYLLGSQSRSNAITVFDRGPHLDYASGVGQVGVPLSPLVPHVHNITSPPTYAVVGGSTLPPGLALDTRTGVISGTPTSPGTTYATIRVTGSDGQNTTSSVRIAISDQPVPPGLSYPDGKGRQGVALDPLVPHTSGFPGLPTYSLKSGKLPDGVTLDPSTGVITGTPTNSGSFAATVTATNGADSADAQVSVIVKAVSAPHLDYPSGQGQVGKKIDPLAPHTFDVPPPQKYSVTKGSLPDGLKLDSDSGVISGTPTKKGNNAFTVTVTGGSASASAGVEIDVSDKPLDPALSYPDGRGEQGRKLVPLTPHTSGLTGNLSYRLVGGELPQGVSLSTSSGDISGKPFNTGTFSATVQVSGDEGSATAKVSLQIRKGAGTWTRLNVKALGQYKKLPVGQATKVIKKVSSDGAVTVSTKCRVKGATVNKYCRTAVSKRHHVTVTPRCNSKVSYSVTIRAKKPGAHLNKWQRTWKVDPKPRRACSAKGTG